MHRPPTVLPDSAMHVVSLIIVMVVGFASMARASETVPIDFTPQEKAYIGEAGAIKMGSSRLTGEGGLDFEEEVG